MLYNALIASLVMLCNVAINANCIINGSDYEIEYKFTDPENTRAVISKLGRGGSACSSDNDLPRALSVKVFNGWMGFKAVDMDAVRAKIAELVLQNPTLKKVAPDLVITGTRFGWTVEPYFSKELGEFGVKYTID